MALTAHINLPSQWREQSPSNKFYVIILFFSKFGYTETENYSAEKFLYGSNIKYN